MGNPRLEEPTSESEIFSLATHVLSIPLPSMHVGDTLAHIALVGEGEDWRVQHAVDGYKKEYGGRLLIAPFNTMETTTKQLTPELLQSRYLLSAEEASRAIIGGHADHTRAQAEWFYNLHLEHRFAGVMIYASPYHVVRAYLTFLKYLLDVGCKIPMFARPTPIPPVTTVPESKINSWDLIHGEAGRIRRYQGKGHVATVQELREYLDWLWSQPSIRSYSPQ